MTKLMLLAILVAGCAKEPPKPAPVAGLSAAEIQRAREACRAYADAACRCAGSAGAQQCALAKPLPEALEMAIQAADQAGEAPTTQPRAEVLVRETVKECVDALAKLPALGCR